MSENNNVSVTRERIAIPTYEPAPPDRNPMFLERRVYQGSSGKVYPLPFYDRIATEKTTREWDSVTLENEYVRVMLLPELGGRIHAAMDKTNGYDFIYRQEVIKPALVGLAGPWVSGGVEFNWPQHHRPATFMPVSVEVEHHDDGSVTVWMSDHEPMTRMKGMHGVCLHPSNSRVEIKARLYNRTQFVQTFLWWANVGVKVHEQFQSFFPPDVHYVADHAKRAVVEFPTCRGRYYGVDYSPGTRLDWYKNIPVPTSYMITGTDGDFFGGYDHGLRAGLVHVANHHISPGKKQWTWGNHKFGYAWDYNLCDDGAPYVELMAGVYTDNQPDFSFLQPGETKTFSQFWYPIREIGPATKANDFGAVSLRVDGQSAKIGVSVCADRPQSRIVLRTGSKIVAKFTQDLSPSQPFTSECALPSGISEADLTLEVFDAAENCLIAYTPPAAKAGDPPLSATEPPLPADIASNDELYITGLHLQQYRHATRDPLLYWQEALRRDPLDIRCNVAMGWRAVRRGEWDIAVTYFANAIERLTGRNPNPYDGEAFYGLGVALRFLKRDAQAYAALYKSVWNNAWQSSGYHQLAEIDASNGDWDKALDHLDRSLSVGTVNLRARDLRAIALARLGRDDEARSYLAETLALDPLDWWAHQITGDSLACDNQTRIDIAIDFGRAGLFDDAIAVLNYANGNANDGTAPLVQYYLGYFHVRAGRNAEGLRCFRHATATARDYCFPSRLEEIVVLQEAMAHNPDDPNAPYYLGNLFYDKRRRADAINLWERAARLDGANATAWRNLGIAYYNELGDEARAKDVYDRAFDADPNDPRLLFERDQLWKRLGVTLDEREAELSAHGDLIRKRDDLTVEYCSLLNTLGKYAEALELLTSRTFQPWEGGEGLTLREYVRATLQRGQAELAVGNASAAVTDIASALDPPKNLGEAWHLLANQSDVRYHLGRAYAADGDSAKADLEWEAAAAAEGDFQEMSVRAMSEMTYYKALSLIELGRADEATDLLHTLDSYARDLKASVAKIDYFATSLPTMLIFEDDLQRRQSIAADFLSAQAAAGLGHTDDAR